MDKMERVRKKGESGLWNLNEPQPPELFGWECGVAGAFLKQLDSRMSWRRRDTNMNLWFLKPLFAAVILAAVVAAGCTTTQSPHLQVNDVRITAEVKSKLAEDVTPSSLVNVQVNTTNGVVTLAGQVETDQVKQRAETVTRHVPGVVGVNDNLQVEPLPTDAVRHGNS
jgi:BON domain